MTWTRFMDMHGGGTTKIEPYDTIYVELPEAEAVAWFRRVLNRDPYGVYCACCGEDYVVVEGATLDKITAYDRGIDLWRDGGYVERPGQPVASVDEYAARPDVLVVRASEIDMPQTQAVAPC